MYTKMRFVCLYYKTKTVFRKHVVYTSITKGQYMLSQKVNKLPNDNIHRLNVTS